MVIIEIKNGNILEEKMCIAHQCNCISKNGKGLSKQINDKYPYANIYKTREHNSQCGTISIHNSENNPTIICMFAQFCPGIPKSLYDSANNRVKWFEQCIDTIIQSNFTDIAMPFGIGCGLAGGDWNTYYKILQNCKLNVTLYKL